MIVSSYLFHLRARNFSAHTIKAAKDYLTPFVACHDPLTATKRDIEQYLISLSARCKPSMVWTAWRHLKGLFNYLHTEGDIDTCRELTYSALLKTLTLYKISYGVY